MVHPKRPQPNQRKQENAGDPLRCFSRRIGGTHPHRRLLQSAEFLIFKLDGVLSQPTGEEKRLHRARGISGPTPSVRHTRSNAYTVC